MWTLLRYLTVLITVFHVCQSMNLETICFDNFGGDLITIQGDNCDVAFVDTADHVEQFYYCPADPANFCANDETVEPEIIQNVQTTKPISTVYPSCTYWPKALCGSGPEDLDCDMVQCFATNTNTSTGVPRSIVCENMLYDLNATLSMNGENSFCNVSVRLFNLTCSGVNQECYCRLTCDFEQVFYELQNNLIEADTEAHTIRYNHLDALTLNKSDAWSTADFANKVIFTTQLGTEAIFVDKSGDVLTFHFTEDAVHTIILQKLGFLQLYATNESVYSITLPDVVTSVSGPLTIKVYVNGTLALTKIVQIIGVKNCRFHDCLVCSNAVNNWSCLSTYYKTVLIVGLIILCLMAIALFPVAFYSIKWMMTSLVWTPVVGTCRFCFNFRKIWIVRWAMSKMRTAKKKTTEVLSPVDDEEVSVQMSNEDVALNNFINKRPIKSMPALNMAVVLAFCVSHAMGQCSDGIFIPTDNLVCQDIVKSGVISTQTCNVTFSIATTITNPGSSSCFTLQDPSTNAVMFRGQISYDFMLDKIGMELQYYTIDWVGDSQSNYRCYKSGHCSTSECNAVAADPQDKTAQGELHNYNVVHWPGAARCTRRGGCAANGCFVCKPACVYSGFGIVPKGYGMTVYTLGQRQHIPAATLTMGNTNGDIISSQAVFTSGTANLNLAGSPQFKLTIVGSLVGSTTEFGDNKVVLLQNVAHLMPASDVNNPVAYNVGDIQSNDQSAFSIPNPQSFIFAPDIMTIDEETKTDIYNFATSGASTVSDETALPFAINGNLWVYTDDEYLSSNLTDPGALVLKFSTIGNYTFTRRIDVVCPTGSLDSASGCTNCESGASATLSLKSTCSPGDVSVIADSADIQVSTVFVPLTNDLTSVIVYFQTTQINNDFNLIFIGTTDNLTVNVQFTAVQDAFVNNRTTRSSDSQYKGGSGWGGFKNFFGHDIAKFFDRIFRGIAHWWEYIVGVGIAIVIGLVIIFMLPSTLKLGITPLKSGFSRFKNMRRKKMV